MFFEQNLLYKMTYAQALHYRIMIDKAVIPQIGNQEQKKQRIKHQEPKQIPREPITNLQSVGIVSCINYKSRQRREEGRVLNLRGAQEDQTPFLVKGRQRSRCKRRRSTSAEAAKASKHHRRGGPYQYHHLLLFLLFLALPGSDCRCLMFLRTGQLD